MTKSKTSISKAQSDKEIGDFWDTHDLGENWDDTQAVEFDVDIPHVRSRVAARNKTSKQNKSSGTNSRKPLEVFYSYAHKDEELRDQLEIHLAMLKREGLIEGWHDRRIVAGEEWDGKIDEHLNSAEIILLLVSPEFIASEYCYDIEVKRAMARHEAGEALVVPIILRPSDWQKSPFSKVQALPKDAKPVTRWQDRDEAFLDVARGIRNAVENMTSCHDTHSPTATVATKHRTRPNIPRPPSTGFVPRQDVDRRRDLVKLLKEELAPEKQKVVALWGSGGVGKTALAAETARELEHVFAGRIVWTSAYSRADFTFSALLDEIATQLGNETLRTLAHDKKAQAVCALACAQPTLVVLDNFETISPEEQQRCVHWLLHIATCPAVVTTRVKIDEAYNIQVGEMSDEEASEFLNRLVEQAQDRTVFSEGIRNQIIKTAEANPYVMQWVFAQIDLADDPEDVFDDLARGKGEVAERVFDRSFNLPQLGDDGRAALLALSLFLPDASRSALAQVAGFGDDTDRVRETIKHLAALRLISTDKHGRRVSVEGLTRSLAKARLSKDTRALDFYQRFVAHFLSYVSAHAQPTSEDYDALEAEKDNVSGAMDLAFEMEDWPSVIEMTDVLAAPVNGMLSVRGYWDESIRRCEQAASAGEKSGDEWAMAQFTGNAATIRTSRGEYDKAKQAYQDSLSAFRKLNSEGNVAVVLHLLAMIAHDKGDLDEARRLYEESLEIKKTMGDQNGTAITLHELGNLSLDQGELAEARRLYDESIGINLKLGDQRGIAATLHQLAMLAGDRGELAEARRLYDESLEINKKLGDQNGIAITLHQLAILAANRGELEEARRLFGQSLEIKKKLGNQSGIAITLYQLGRVAETEDDRSIAEGLFIDSLKIWEKLGSPNAEIARRSLRRVQGESS